MMAPNEQPLVYLASASPRRRELLAQIGVHWKLLVADVDESRAPGEAPQAYVLRLALAKARAASKQVPVVDTFPVVAADTAVVLDAEVLGKPADAADAVRMLGLLSGRTHEVLTAVAVLSARGETVAVSRSKVTFRSITAQEIAAYWDSGEPADKAGAYAIQGLGAIFVQDLCGSYSGVMGLPLFETAGLLRAHGVALLGDCREPA